MSVVDEVKSRINVVDVISRYTPLKRAGSIYKGLCPFHDEKTPSFVVFPQSGNWHCFGACGTGGDVFTFLMRKENLEFREALERLAGEAGVSLDAPEESADRSQRDLLYQANEAACAWFEDILLYNATAAPARDYLARRGIDDETRARFRLGYAPDQWSALHNHLLAKGFSSDVQLTAGLVKHNEERDSLYDAFRKRVIVPIRDRSGRVIGFGGRVLDDSLPKYLNTPDTPLFHKSHVVFGMDQAWQAIRSADQVVIVEGYMDVIALHQFGFQNVVACMGTALTPEQLLQLQRFTSRFVLALDADSAGQAATIRGLNQARQALTHVTRPSIQPGGRIRMTERLAASLSILSIPEGKDPDELVRHDPELWKRSVAEAKPLVDFFFDVVSARGNLDSAEGKAQAVEELAPLIAELQDAIERDEYVQRLSRLVRVQEVIIEGRVRAAARLPSRSRTQESRPAGEPTAEGPTSDGPTPDSADEDGPSSSRSETRRQPAALALLGSEDHFLAVLLREPDLLVWLAGQSEVLHLEPPSPADLAHAENREIFSALKRYLTSDDSWDFETFQDSLPGALHAKLGTLVAYGAQLPPRSASELREGMIKDIVHLRLQKLKAEGMAVKYLVDDAQRNGEAESARAMGTVYGRIQRELEHLQPLILRENLGRNKSRGATSANFGMT